MADKLKIGDIVHINTTGRRRYGTHFTKGKAYKIVGRHGKPCVYTNGGISWIDECLGLQVCFELASAIRIGGE